MNKEYVAIHEAGHAVVGLLLGAPLDVVTIVRSDEHGSLGHAIHTHGQPLNHIGGEYWALTVRAITSLAGHAATIRLGHNETPEEAGADNDYRSVFCALDSITGGGDVDPLLERAWAATQLIVDMAWRSIEMVAELLEEHGTITEQDIRELLDMESIPAWAQSSL